MQHKVKVTVLDKKLYKDLQTQYCADADSGMCPCYNIGDEFVFKRFGTRDDFWHMGLNTLVKSSTFKNHTQDHVSGGPAIPHCSEAWDAIARYIYTGLQGGAIMRNWMNDERIMITCCSDGTRPVIFKIERIDYKVIYLSDFDSLTCEDTITKELLKIDEVTDIEFNYEEKFIEVSLKHDINDDSLSYAIENATTEHTVLNIV